MFVITESNQRINLEEKHITKYITNNKGEKSEKKVKKYSDPYVRPLEKDKKIIWCVCMDNLYKTNNEDTIIIIISFESVDDANTALDAIKINKQQNYGWDALEYKKRKDE